MPEPQKFESYSEFMSHLWSALNPRADPRSLSRLISAESCWMQEPSATAATARPDLETVDGWAEKIENTKAFGRMLNSPGLDQRIADRDAEGLMTDFHTELVSHMKDGPQAPEPELSVEKRRQEPQKAAPDGPQLTPPHP